MKRIIRIRKMKYENARNLFLRELDHAFCNGYLEVKVLHGIGQEILKKMVYNEVENITYAKIKNSKNIFSSSHYNPGVTSISIDPLSFDLQKKYF